MEHEWGPWQGSKASAGGQYRLCELCGTRHVAGESVPGDCLAYRPTCRNCMYMKNLQCRRYPQQLYVVTYPNGQQQVEQDWPAVGPKHPACGEYRASEITPIANVDTDRIKLGDVVRTISVLDPADPDAETDKVVLLVALGVARNEDGSICLAIPADGAGTEPLRVALTGPHGTLGAADTLVSRWLDMMEAAL